jgi:hypothetical protein
MASQTIGSDHLGHLDLLWILENDLLYTDMHTILER